MSTNTKIYTAKEVQSAGINEEEINQALATITQKAYEAAKEGKIQLSHSGTNLNFLSEMAHRLKELGYTTEIFETAINDSIIIYWGNTQPL